jgi:hypothetical protein
MRDPPCHALPFRRGLRPALIGRGWGIGSGLLYRALGQVVRPVDAPPDHFQHLEHVIAPPSTAHDSMSKVANDLFSKWLMLSTQDQRLAVWTERPGARAAGINAARKLLANTSPVRPPSCKPVDTQKPLQWSRTACQPTSVRAQAISGKCWQRVRRHPDGVRRSGSETSVQPTARTLANRGEATAAAVADFWTARRHRFSVDEIEQSWRG